MIIPIKREVIDRFKLFVAALYNPISKYAEKDEKDKQRDNRVDANAGDIFKIIPELHNSALNDLW